MTKGGDGKDRRKDVIRAARRHIAERGMEGLRVRGVAEAAGINHATLLHYFPSKEAMVRAVVEAIEGEFQRPRLPPADHPLTVRERLLREYEDTLLRLKDDPETMVVIIELNLRAHRDPVVASILTGMYTGWRHYLLSLIKDGVASGEFRQDTDPGEVADTIMVQVKGLAVEALFSTSEGQLDRLVKTLAREMDRHLTTPKHH